MTVLDAPRVKLLIATGQWPAASEKPPPTYPARLQRLLDAGQVSACDWCGVALPAPPGDWSTCDRCEAGAGAYGLRWPLVAALDTFFRRESDARVRERVLARRHLLLDNLPSYRGLPGAQPTLPIKPWSALALPIPEAPLAPHGGAPLLSTVTVRSETGATRYGDIGRFHVEPLPGHKYPSWLTAVAAAIAAARAEIAGGEITGPPNGQIACAWCGIGSVPRVDWRLIDGRAWCGGGSAGEADCPYPLYGSPARDRAQCVSVILDQGYDVGVVEQAHRSGRLPPVRFQDQPDDERAKGGWTAPFGWLSDDDLDGLRALLDEIGEPNNERVAVRLATAEIEAAAAQRALEAREAERAEDREAIRAELVAEAERIASERTSRSTVRRVKVQPTAPDHPSEIAARRLAEQQAQLDRARRASRAQRQRAKMAAKKAGR